MDPADAEADPGRAEPVGERQRHAACRRARPRSRSSRCPSTKPSRIASSVGDSASAAWRCSSRSSARLDPEDAALAAGVGRLEHRRQADRSRAPRRPLARSRTAANGGCGTPSSASTRRIAILCVIRCATSLPIVGQPEALGDRGDDRHGTVGRDGQRRRRRRGGARPPSTASTSVKSTTSGTSARRRPGASALRSTATTRRPLSRACRIARRWWRPAPTKRSVFIAAMLDDRSRRAALAVPVVGIDQPAPNDDPRRRGAGSGVAEPALRSRSGAPRRRTRPGSHGRRGRTPRTLGPATHRRRAVRVAPVPGYTRRVSLAGKRIVITGGAGFIGTTLARRLVDDNEVVAVDNLHRDALSGTDLADHPNFHFDQADVLDRERARARSSRARPTSSTRGDRRRRHRPREPRAHDARQRDRHLQRARGGARDAATRSSGCRVLDERGLRAARLQRRARGT